MIFVNGESVKEKVQMNLAERKIEFFSGKSSMVKELNLSFNHLVLFTPVGEGAFPNLKELYLSGNQLTSFSPTRGAFPNLKELHLIRNQLTSFSVEKGALPKLKALYLSDNQLTSFSAEEGTFPKLRELHFYNNRLILFLVEEAFPKLEELYLDDNQLTSLVVECSFPELNTLSVSDNPNLEVLEVTAPKLDSLLISNTKIRFLDGTLVKKVRDYKNVKAHEHARGTKRLVIQAFHEGNPIVEEIVAHLTR